MCLYLNSSLTRCPPPPLLLLPSLPPPPVVLVQPVRSTRAGSSLKFKLDQILQQLQRAARAERDGAEDLTGGRRNRTDKVTPSRVAAGADLLASEDRPQQRTDEERDSARAEQESVSPRAQAACSAARGGRSSARSRDVLKSPFSHRPDPGEKLRSCREPG